MPEVNILHGLISPTNSLSSYAKILLAQIYSRTLKLIAIFQANKTFTNTRIQLTKWLDVKIYIKLQKTI